MILSRPNFISKGVTLAILKEEGKQPWDIERLAREDMRFMASSLDKLSSNLKINQFVNLKKYYSGNQLSLLLRNGVYPYDYVDCIKN